MAKQSRPWFRASKRTWYCTQEGRKVSLGVKGEENEAAAIKAWHRLMAGDVPAKPKPTPPQRQEPAVGDKAKAATVQAIIDGFLADGAERMPT